MSLEEYCAEEDCYGLSRLVVEVRERLVAEGDPRKLARYYDLLQTVEASTEISKAAPSLVANTLARLPFCHETEIVRRSTADLKL